jgi:hypothetical protein
LNIGRPDLLSRLQAGCSKACEISEGGGCLEYLQSFPTLPIEALEWSDELSVCEKLRALVPEAQDHRREV